VVGLEDRATAALVLAGLNLQGDTGSFGESFVHASVLHRGAFYGTC
jgi:hypothetical protein